MGWRVVYVVTKSVKMAEKPEGLTVTTSTNVFHLTGRPCELSAFSHIPKNHLDTPSERSYFNSLRKVFKKKMTSRHATVKENSQATHYSSYS